MKNEEKKEFGKLLYGLSINFDKELKPELLDLFFDNLKQFSLSDVKKAAGKIISECKYFPKLAEFIEKIQGNPQIQLENKAKEAWNKVEIGLWKIGNYGVGMFDDKYIHLVIKRLGGWIQFVGKTNDELIWIKKNFEKCYSDAITQPINEDIPAEIGLAQGKSWTKEKPILIGDNNKKLLN